MRKIIVLLTALMLSANVFATGTGGAPSLPCYFDGKLHHTTIPITVCIKGGGSPYKDGQAS